MSWRNLIPAELAKGFGFLPVEASFELFAGRRNTR